MRFQEESKKENFDEQQIVVFSLAKEEFGVNINEVREIIKWESVTRIPNTLDYIKGVINLRGGIIVVVDFAKKLNLPSKEIDKNSRIIVIENNGNKVGMIVDSATEVLRLPADKIQPAPKIITDKIQNKFIKGVGILGQRLLILLDLTKIFEEKDLEQLQQSIDESINKK